MHGVIFIVLCFVHCRTVIEVISHVPLSYRLFEAHLSETERWLLKIQKVLVF